MLTLTLPGDITFSGTPVVQFSPTAATVTGLSATAPTIRFTISSMTVADFNEGATVRLNVDGIINPGSAFSSRSPSVRR